MFTSRDSVCWSPNLPGGLSTGLAASEKFSEERKLALQLISEIH